MISTWDAHRLTVRNSAGKIIISIGTYQLQTSPVIVIEHCWREPAISDERLAESFIQALAKIKDENKLVLPLCPFAEEFMRSHPEYSMLLAKKAE